MITSFSPKTIHELGYYVYIYSDPDTHKPFYVGKGKGNRVFDHLFLEDESKKVAYIKHLIENGKQPIIEILVHGVNEDTAFKVEAVAIDLIGIENLTNKQRGHHSSLYGKIEVSLLESRYNCEELALEDFNENIMLFRVTELYHNDMTPYEIYEITRGYWKINLERAKQAKYALAIYDGMVLDVYEIMEWFPAFSTMTYQRKDNQEKLKDRFEFVGNIAPENIRKNIKINLLKTFF